MTLYLVEVKGSQLVSSGEVVKGGLSEMEGKLKHQLWVGVAHNWVK